MLTKDRSFNALKSLISSTNASLQPCVRTGPLVGDDTIIKAFDSEIDSDVRWQLLSSEDNERTRRLFVPMKNIIKHVKHSETESVTSLATEEKLKKLSMKVGEFVETADVTTFKVGFPFIN